MEATAGTQEDEAHKDVSYGNKRGRGCLDSTRVSSPVTWRRVKHDDEEISR